MPWGKWMGVVLSVLGAAVLPWLPVAAAAPPRFADPAFEQVWQRTDAAVAAGQVIGGWLWGPEGFNQRREPYLDSLQQGRLVQYFDKSRMEVNDPSGDRGNLFFVTNGLLAKEMVSGNIQVGAFRFAADVPAVIPVAGDPEDPTGPTYASFQNLASLEAGSNRAAVRTGQSVTATITREGTVGAVANPPAAVVLAQYSDPLGHNIPDVFLTYLQNLPLDWVFVMGLPITEAYWARAQVGGQPRDVLVQVYERRVLTFTPTNPPEWRVEMGNVGRHYYHWRYETRDGDPARPRGYTLVDLAYNSPALAATFGLPRDRVGLVLTYVHPGGPAASAGLQRGDLIVAVNRHAVTSVFDAAAGDKFLQAVRRTAPGGSLLVTVWRRGQEREVRLSTGPLPGDFQRVAVQELTRQIVANPRDAIAFWVRGRYQAAAADTIVDVSRALELNPNLTDAYWDRAGAERDAADETRAVADYRKVAESTAPIALRYQAFVRLADLLNGRGDRAGAIDAAQRAIAVATDEPSAWTSLAAVYKDQAAFDRALEAAANAIRLGPLAREGLPYYLRGVAEQARGMRQEAALDFQVAIALTTDQRLQDDMVNRLGQLGPVGP